MAFHQAGNVAEAERCYRSVLAVKPDQFDALHHLGVLEAQRGRYEEALHLIGRALEISPRSIEAHMSHANVLKTLGRHAEALASCDSALAINPDFALAHYNRGNVLLEQGRYEEALASYERVLAIMPGNAMALYNHGNVLQLLGRHAEAVASHDRLLAIAPGNAAALYNRGVAMMSLKRYEEALASYDGALAIAPADAEALTNRGIALYELRRYEEALASYDKALAIRPGFAEALNNRGNVLRELTRPEEALASCEQALAIKPDYLEALNNRGIALEALNRHVEALASYDRALAINPGYADAHWAASLCSLALGDFERGWREYEWRWRTEDFPSPRRGFPGPLWLGQEDIRGKTILLYGEQGLGDTIQFCRYIERVAASGARVILEVPPPLKLLLSDLRGARQALAAGEKLPEFDFHCPLLSLPLAFKTTLATVPSQVPYLEATPDLVGEWRTRLAQTMGSHDFKIGICWQGKPTAKVDIGRSIPLREFQPLARIPGVRLIGLQKHHGLEQLANLPSGMRVETLGDDFDAGARAFVDSAAVMENLDLIVTSDTSVAHLAGALGRPTWLALKYVPDWRWLLERNDSPWYPTMRIFRQNKPDDWRAVFDAMSRELAALVSSR